MRHFEEYPKFKYAEGREPRVVESREEEDELRAGEAEWFDKPNFTNHVYDISTVSETTGVNARRAYVEYPKMKYSEGKEPRIVDNREEEDELGDGWFDKPDFTNHELSAPEDDETPETDGEEAPAPAPTTGRRRRAAPASEGGEDLI